MNKQTQTTDKDLGTLAKDACAVPKVQQPSSCSEGDLDNFAG